ncbi:MAG: methyltransferase domain-containing protein [Candidatus Lokiarchaeota archaeon]|nr:methyltransferase domain-containing protein [Candidatus Lokiarchaeota archaeon]
MNFIFCPSCAGELTSVALEEIITEDNSDSREVFNGTNKKQEEIITEVNNDSSEVFNKTNKKTYPSNVLHRNSSDVLNRINNISAVIGPIPHFRRNTTFTKILTKHSSPFYLPDRKQDVDNVDIKKGLLVCGECGHWYPVSNFVPELLPDHLRDWEKDVKFLSEFSESLPKKLYKKLVKIVKSFRRESNKIIDEAQDYKKAEISIKDKITDEDFFEPGYSSPFNEDDPEFTQNLIKRFSLVLPLLELKEHQTVLDVGSGYSWTTEWLLKMGFEPIGVDICRTYIDIGIERMGDIRPHLIVADVENLPIKDTCLDSILCYDSFHHVPNRESAMAHFFRALREDGLVALAEPGKEHEQAQVSMEVMEKYGILEKGIETEDIKAYCEELNFMPPEQYFMLKIHQREQGKVLTPKFIKSHSLVECNIFVIRKNSEEKEGGN